MLLTSLMLPATGQQSPMYTQYMFNQLLYNPALAGVDPYYQIRSNHRFQWVGITDAPLTNALAICGPHPNLPMGYGGYIYHDVTGPTSQTSITGTYAYNIGLTDRLRLSMGISAGVMQYRVDGTQITLKDPSDQALQDAVYTSWVPDANLGLYLYHENFYVGFSTAHLITTNLKLYEPGIGINKLKTHFFLTGGYIWNISQDFTLEPSAMLKGSLPHALQFDINATFDLPIEILIQNLCIFRCRNDEHLVSGHRLVGMGGVEMPPFTGFGISQKGTQEKSQYKYEK